VNIFRELSSAPMEKKKMLLKILAGKIIFKSMLKIPIITFLKRKESLPLHRN